MRKIRQTQDRVILQHSSHLHIRNGNIMNKGRLRNYSKLKESREKRQLSAIYDADWILN